MRLYVNSVLPGYDFGCIRLGGGDAVRLRELARGLENVKFVDYQPICRMPEIYAASDLFYVGQDPQACSDGIPSKIYRILGYRKPLLVMTSPDSDLAKFVQDLGGGMQIGEDIESAVSVVRSLMGDPIRLESLGKSGRLYVEKSFSKATISSKYDSVCKAVAKRYSKN